MNREERIRSFREDPQVQAILEEPERAERIKRLSIISAPILESLRQAGYNVESLYQLRHTGKPWKAALPVLQHWLPLIDEPGIKEEIVRCLSVPWISNKVTAQLIDEFKKTDPGSSLGWAIGNALSIVSIKGYEKEIVALCKDQKYGRARQMIVHGLDRIHDSIAEQAALDLLGDEEVKLHAMISLKKMKSKRALPQLEKLLTDERAIIRKEARKAIAKIRG